MTTENLTTPVKFCIRFALSAATLVALRAVYRAATRPKHAPLASRMPKRRRESPTATMQSQRRLQLCEFLSDVNTHSYYINISSARKRGARLGVKNQNGGYHPVAVEFGLLCIRAFVQRQGDSATRVGRLKGHTYDAIETTLRNEFCFGYSQWLNPHSEIHFIRAPLKTSDDKTPNSFCNFYLSEQLRHEAAEVAFDLVFENIKSTIAWMWKH